MYSKITKLRIIRKIRNELKYIRQLKELDTDNKIFIYTMLSGVGISIILLMGTFIYNACRV